MRARGNLVAVALAGLVVIAGSPARAATPPACLEIEFSPDFARDNTMFCATTSRGAALLFRSRDGGRSWGPPRTVAADGADGTVGIVISPLFSHDRLLLVSTAFGLYQSSDGGASFTKIGDENAPPAASMTPYVETLSPSRRPHAAFAAAELAYVGGRVYDTELGVREVVEAPAFDEQFIIPPDYGTTRQAVVLASQVGLYHEDKAVTEPGAGAYLCVGDFACAHRIAYFGDIDITNRGALGAPGHYYAGGSDSTPYFFTPAPPRLEISTFRTRDYGRTWQRWTSLDKLLNREDAYGYALTSSSDAPKRLFLYVRGDWRKTSTARPEIQLFRSDDDGGTWRRVGFGWGRKQRSSVRATLPWNDTKAATFNVPVLVAQPGGRLYIVGEQYSGKKLAFRGMFCSTTLGRTWRRGTC